MGPEWLISNLSITENCLPWEVRCRCSLGKLLKTCMRHGRSYCSVRLCFVFVGVWKELLRISIWILFYPFFRQVFKGIDPPGERTPSIESRQSSRVRSSHRAMAERRMRQRHYEIFLQVTWWLITNGKIARQSASLLDNTFHHVSLLKAFHILSWTKKWLDQQLTKKPNGWPLST